MNQSGDIDDCVNSVYLELMEKLQQYNETRGSMGAFVAIITRSCALDYCRGNMRENGNFSVSSVKDKNKLDFIREPLDFENEVEFEMLVEHILGKLNENENILFTMKFILFYSPEEIAKAFNIRRNTVDVRINRLKSKVKKLLIKGGITL